MSKKLSPKKNFTVGTFSDFAAHPLRIGIIEAPDEQTAVKKAIDDFQITNPEQQRRLVAQRRR
jgi:hypothetical protein